MIEWFSILSHIRITWGRFYISGHLHLTPKVSDLTGQGCGLEIRGLKSSLGDVKCICHRGECFWLCCAHDKSWGESGQNVVPIQWVWDRAWALHFQQASRWYSYRWWGPHFSRHQMTWISFLVPSIQTRTKELFLSCTCTDSSNTIYS